MQPDKFWYIKLRDHGTRGERKIPAEPWGSYTDDFEDLDNVYTYEETQTHTHGNYGIVGTRVENQKLIVVDVDTHDIPEFDEDLLGFDVNRVPFVRSRKPDGPSGYHGYYVAQRISEEITIEPAQSWVDVKAHDQGHVVSPFHENEWYDSLNDAELYQIYDHDEVNLTFSYDDRDLVQPTSTREFESLDVPDDPPREIPSCVHELLQHRRDLDRSRTDIDPFKLDTAVGIRLVAFGYSIEDAMSLLREYPPEDGFDERESRYQLELLYKKQLYPHSRASLDEIGVQLSPCTCQHCDTRSDLVATNPARADEWTVDTEGEIPNVAMPSIARTGKSYTMIREAARCLDRDTRVVYVSSAHSEAEATVEKFKEHGVTDVAYLTGRDRALEEYNVTCTGDFRQTASAKTPREAARLSNCNQYLALTRGCKNAQVVVTVPEKLRDIGDRDWVIMTEEAAFNRILSSSVNVIDVERHLGDDRVVKKKLSTRVDRLQRIVDHIDDLDQVQRVHRWVRTTARGMVQVCRRIDNWLPVDWNAVDESWESLVDDVESLLSDIEFAEQPVLSRARKWLERFPDLRESILNVMFHDGVNSYENDEKKQLFIVGDCDELFVPLPESVDTIWTAGNSLPHMEHFHEISHGDEYEVKPFYGGVTPVQDCIRVIKYTGGDNQNIQANHVQRAIEELQRALAPSDDTVSGLLVSGSSKHCASHAERINRCTSPSENDTLEDVRYYLNHATVVAIPENSQFSEGVDTPEADFGALYNGNFATPREDYMAETYGRRDLKKAEKIRAAQNSILRPSDVLDDDMVQYGTGVTPVIVPDMHVPDEIWALFEEYGVSVWEQRDIVDVKKLLVTFIDSDDVEVHGDRVLHVDDTPEEVSDVKRLILEQGSSRRLD